MTGHGIARVPVADPRRDVRADRAALLDAVASVLDGGRYVRGPEHAAFEVELAAFVGLDECVGVASGTDALVLALLGLGVEAGSTVLATANAGGYATTAARSLGCEVQYVDVDPATLQADPAEVDLALARFRPAAVVVTHLYGDPAPSPTIVELCREHGVPVVEDCAQALGLEVEGRHAGAWGDVATMSFYPTKNLGGVGDGGAVLTSSTDLADRVRSLSQYGWDGKYEVVRDHGRNSRLDELQAAMLRRRLPLVAARRSERRRILGSLAEALPREAGRFVTSPAGAVHLAVVLTSDRDHFRRTLARHGVDTDVHYPVPDHLQPAWRTEATRSMPVTEDACERVVTVPCFSGMVDDEVQQVCEALRAVV